MARHFNDTDGTNYIVISPGTLTTWSQGAFTVGFIWNPTNNTHAGGIFRSFQNVGAGGSNDILHANNYSDGNLYLTVGAFQSTAYAAGWQCSFITKASGTLTPRYHTRPYSTGIWSHTNFGGTLANQATAVGEIRIGTFNSSTEGLRGDIEIMGAWKRELSDAEIDTNTFHTRYQAWVGASPDALWPFNQGSTATPVSDVTGNGANQTSLSGTSVTSGPVEFTYESFFHMIRQNTILR